MHRPWSSADYWLVSTACSALIVRWPHINYLKKKERKKQKTKTKHYRLAYSPTRSCGGCTFSVEDVSFLITRSWIRQPGKAGIKPGRQHRKHLSPSTSFLETLPSILFSSHCYDQLYNLTSNFGEDRLVLALSLRMDTVHGSREGMSLRQLFTSVVITNTQLTGMGPHYKTVKSTDSLPPVKVPVLKFPQPSENDHHPGDV